MAIISKPSISQEFLGIKVDGKIKDVVEAFKIKEFTAYENISPDGSILLMGQAGGNQVGLVIAYTPKKKIVWEFIVFLPESKYWSMLKENYEKYLEILISKYGNPQVKRAEFSEPYYEGDGYEMQAIENNKCSYVAKWKDEIGIAITISIIKRVQIYYKNYLNEIIYEREKLEINKEGF